jgi:hypothetical protein
MDAYSPLLPPVEMVMPQAAQSVFMAANVLVCIIALGLAERYRRKYRSSVGFLILLAGALSVFNEPVVDVLGLCWFAARGSTPLFVAWGVTIPAFMLPVYCWYVGGQALLVLMALQQGATIRQIFQMYAVFALVNILLEVPGLKMGIYAYYGRQPLMLFGFPCWWVICNGLMPIVMAAIVFRLQPFLSGPRRLLIALVGPMAAGITNGAIAIPVWVALNSGMQLWATQIAAAISLCMGLMLAFLVTQAVATDRDSQLGRLFTIR